MSKHLLPKKTYLLNRSTVSEEKAPVQQDSVKNGDSGEYLLESSVNTIVSLQDNITSTHKDTASAIDNLVKAAELLETQSEKLDTSMPSTSTATPQATPVKRGRGRPRKYPLPDGTPDKLKTPSPQKKPRLSAKKPRRSKHSTDSDDDSSAEEGIARENWTMGKINENIVCPICSKLFRSENVVFKHVKHCTGPSPNRLDSGKRSRRRSRRSGEVRKSRGSKSSNDTNDPEKEKPKKGGTPKKRKSNETATTSSDKDDIVVIEDSPATDKPVKHVSRRPGRPRLYPKNAIFECEFCGKTFRQMSYLVNHKMQHKKNNAKKEEMKPIEDNSIFSCDVCKKEFRKLHHLVQHRLIHNSNGGLSKPTRKSSSEQSDKSKDQDMVKQGDEQNAAFRCEPCDKSFRKLHHLVEHRETHDGINRQKNPSGLVSDEKPINTDPPQCDICKKTFRKLHHLIEHKEQHNDTSSDKSDDKSVKSSLSTKDIIHECSLCYMVFPNEHSLNKHTIICQKKKKQAAAKDLKTAELSESKEESKINHADNQSKNEDQIESDNIESQPIASTTIVSKEMEKIGSEKLHDNFAEIPGPQSTMKISEILQNRLLKASNPEPTESPKLIEPAIVESKVWPTKRESVSVDAKDIEPEVPAKLAKLEEKPKDKVTTDETPKKKVICKEKIAPTVTKRRKSSNLQLSVVEEVPPSIESSDDDEVRYMFNPEFKEEKNNESTFMKVRADKRNSLQVERPNSKELVKRRTSLQHPLKVPRLKPKPIEVRIPSSSTIKPPKLVSIASIDSDDSDVKYSFPENVNENSKAEVTDVKLNETPKITKDKKKSLVEKRKTLTGIAKRKSLGKVTGPIKDKPSPVRQIKKRITEVEHRCDCGQLFNSAALLARHTSLAHTPPRIRRRRSPPPDTKPTPRKSASKTAGTRKSSINDKSKPTDLQKPSVNEKVKMVHSRKPIVNEKRKVTDSPKSSVNAKVKSTSSRKSSLIDKAKNANPSKSSTIEKANSANKRKSGLNDKPNATDSRKPSVKSDTSNSNVKVLKKSESTSKDNTPIRKSMRVEVSESSKRTITKIRRNIAHRGVPVPDKLKKLLEKTKK